MGIEKFFNTLLSSYKEKLITDFQTSSANILFFDFNSIIHKLSSQTVSDMNYLYKILLISDKFPSNKLIDFFKNKYQGYTTIFYLSIDFLHTPSGIKQLLVDIKKIDINMVIINKILKELEYYISRISDLEQVYISIDGVPTIGKILEQRHRRYIGEIINYKNQLTIQSFVFPDKISEEYPYDFAEYNKNKFMFHKLHISPGTHFMKQVIKSIKHHIFPVPVQINDDSISGEGEFKIINYIRTYDDLFIEKKIIIYSPDSDMILMSSILPHDIFILRYDQQKHKDFILSTEIFKKIILEYILGPSQKKESESNKQFIINDILFIFTVFGDDFIPKLDSIPIHTNFDKILNIYTSMSTIHNGFIIQQDTINIKQLKVFFKELELLEIPNLKKQFSITGEYDTIYSLPKTSYLRKKDSSFNNDPIDGKIINRLNKNIHDSNYLEDSYSVEFILHPPKEYDLKISEEYIHGLQWIYNYYFLSEIDYTWYYPFEKAPYIREINMYLTSIDELSIYKKDYEEVYPLIFSPIEQTIYTSPIDITDMLSNKYKNIVKQLYKKYPLANILQKIQNIDCTSSNYLSKCSLKNINHPIHKLSPREFIKEFRSEKTRNEFMKYVKYYTITNDPYFYSQIK
jgi:5'-3' exonuclease